MVEEAQPAVSSVGVVTTEPQARLRNWLPVRSIKVSNFKAIKEAELEIGPLTILVGPNASGKSSILQAVHWAARCASYIAPRSGYETIAFDRLDYIPSSEPLLTAFRSELSSTRARPPISVDFNFEGDEDGNDVPDNQKAATVQIWSARNNGAVSVHISGGALVTPFKQRTRFLTAYIPGLAGLSEEETILAQPSLRRQAAGGDAGSVLRNVIFNLANSTDAQGSTSGEKRLERLNHYLQRVHPGASVRVNFDEREDVIIHAEYTTNSLSGLYRPLETAATGILQVVQIFAYIIFFEPKLLLIDEPDSHLHPDKQEMLVEALEDAVLEYGAQAIMATHSSSVVRASSSQTKIVWMNDGSVVNEDSAVVRRMMGWGAIDRKAIFFIEDENEDALMAIIKQWPDVYRKLAICRCFGVDNLPKNRLLEGLTSGGQLLLGVVIHRDRDFMTGDEVTRWRASYESPGVHAWCTLGADVESYFCTPSYLCALYGLSLDESKSLVSSAVATIIGAKDKFKEKRKVVNRMYADGGGSPSTDDLWNSAGGQTAESVLGKQLWKALKPVIKARGLDDRLLNKFTIPAGHELAPELKQILQLAMNERSKPVGDAGAAPHEGTQEND